VRAAVAHHQLDLTDDRTRPLRIPGRTGDRSNTTAIRRGDQLREVAVAALA
jgi:hypothetical protein